MLSQLRLKKCSNSRKGASRQTAQLDLGTGLSNKKQFIFLFGNFQNFGKMFLCYKYISIFVTTRELEAIYDSYKVVHY